MQESLKAQWEEELRLLQATREMQAMMAKVRQSDQGLALRVQELKAERSRLEDWIKEHRLVKKDLDEALSLHRPPINPRKKTIVLDINGLLMKIKHSWSQTQCVSFQTTREHHKDGVLRCKSIAVLYDHSICDRDVLLLDDSVQKNSTNHPYQALHPRTFDPMKTAKKDDNYLNSVLLPVLDKLRFHRGDMMSFVEANWQAVQAQEPFEHRIKQALQTATDLVTAEENWPSQNPDETGPSQPPDSDLAELGRPLVPAPLTRSAILSETEILLSGSRDEDEELVRLHGDLD
ncbi:hypothetical protein R1sor_004934 [Riccia sorocarpa]|uniref:FCP1 homology domain-containing protein n=1 Tax=Riccia sorocarpa TaxID=122646 RepID=A0ABD3HIM6_9MARC